MSFFDPLAFGQSLILMILDKAIHARNSALFTLCDTICLWGDAPGVYMD